MKNNTIKSFCFEIIIYTLLSLCYTFLTEAAIYGVFWVGKNIWNGFIHKPEIKEVAPTGLPPLEDKVVFPELEKYGGQAGGQLSFHREIKKEVMIIWAVIIVLISLILFVLYFLRLTRKFSNYLEEIVVGIDRVAAGKFDQKIPVKGKDEFTHIAVRLNRMAEDIQVLMENERTNEKTKNELITNVAHDLRTPITSILGYLDLVTKKQDTLEPEVREKYIRIALDKSERLEKLVEDLFSYTKFSEGAIKFNPVEIDMVKFMEQMMEEFYPSFEENHLLYAFESNVPSAVAEVDGDLIARAIANLLGNAIKYGKDGKAIYAQLEERADEVEIRIINYGEMIPEKDIDSIFDKLYRVENSRSRETGGTGLGLAIAKRVITMHGGKISVKSDFQGTIFTVVLKKKAELKTVAELSQETPEPDNRIRKNLESIQDWEKEYSIQKKATKL